MTAEPLDPGADIRLLHTSDVVQVVSDGVHYSFTTKSGSKYELERLPESE